MIIAALTLAVPFDYIDPQAAFPEAFAYFGYPVAKNLTSIGIALGMFGALVRQNICDAVIPFKHSIFIRLYSLYIISKTSLLTVIST